MVFTVLIDEEVMVQKKGPPDPPGSRYCVMDYVNDWAAEVVAQTLATFSKNRESAFADALRRSLDGGGEETPLRVYDIQPQVGVHPNARFIVLHYSHHYPSRVAMGMYPLKMRDRCPELAERVDRALGQSQDDFAAYMKSRYSSKARKGKKRGREGPKAR